MLIADQTLRTAELSLAQSRHDALLAQAMLLTATGGLADAVSLAPDGDKSGSGQ